MRTVSVHPDLTRPSPRPTYQLGALLVLLAVGIAGAARLYYLSEKHAIEDGVRNHLASIANAKVQQLATWQSRHLLRARTIVANRLTKNELLRLISGNGEHVRTPILIWLNALRSEMGAAGVTLTNSRGDIVLSAGNTFDPPHQLRVMSEQAIGGDDVILSDLHREPGSGAVHLSVSIPLRTGSNKSATGMLLIGIDPSAELYPLLDAWPVPSRSAETLLVRRDGSDVLYLNNVRGVPDSALRLRLPLSRTDAPAVRAAKGEETSMEGVDYRGVPVFAAIRHVPGTAWFLVTKLDAEEVRAPLLRRFLMLGIVALSLILAAAAGTVLLWRRQQLDFYRTHYEMVLERRALIGHYDYLSRFANDIILLLNPEGGIVEANDRALAAYGYTRDELQHMNVQALRHSSELASYDQQFKEVEKRESLVFETVHQTREGRAFPVEVSSRMIEVGGERFRQSIIRDISERKAIELERRQALVKLRTVIDASPAAIVTFTPDLLVTSWNPAAEQIFERKASEVIGMPLSLYPEDHREEFLRKAAMVLRGETIIACPLPGLRKDGSRLMLDISAAPLHDDEGRVSGIVAFLQDLTAKHLAEDALAQSEARFRATFEQAAVGMTHTSLDGRFLRVNQRFCDLTGYTAEELRVLRYQDVTHPLDFPENLERAGELVDGKVSGFTIQKRYIRKDRSILWVQVTISMLRSATGEPPYFIVVAENISERIRSEEALRRSEERFRQVVEAAPAGIIVESGGLIRYVNPAGLCMLGAASPGQVVGRSIFEMIHSEDRPAARRRSELIARGIPVPLADRRYLRLDGEPLLVGVSASPIEYDRQPAGLIFFHDLTERQRAVEERARLEEQLRQSQKMEGVGRLAGGVAHDFNNHLTVINGYCDMLLEGMGENEPLRESLKEIRAAGQRATDLTQQLLAFSRKQVVTLKPLNLNDVVEEGGRMLRRLIGEDIVIHTRLASGLPRVLADRGQMNQVLMNLAVNARDAMPRGGTLTIGTTSLEVHDGQSALYPEAKPGRYAGLSVTDTGIGISAEVLEKIFEPFYTTKARSAGTGLGLSTVYGIVQQSGGFIHVSSQPGEGATFEIHIPVTDRPPEPAVEEPPGLESLDGAGTVLVVEDQAEVRKLALSILTKAGYRILEASDGVEALSLAEQHAGAIDLLLTDVIMPGITGKELADRMLARWPGIKVLFVSGYTADVLGRHGVLDPGVSYLSKPFTNVELSRRVREVLGFRRAPGRVLVVDDDDAIRAFMRQVLEAGGYRVASANNGKEAVRLVHQQDFDVVVTDLVMPEQEGLETVRFLRQNRPEIGIIAVSGAFNGDFLKTARMLGAKIALDKPIEAEKLLASVRSLLGSKVPVRPPSPMDSPVPRIQ